MVLCLPQHDLSPLRQASVDIWRGRYYFDKFGGIPVNAVFELNDKVDNSVWDANLLGTSFRIRANIEQVVKVTGWKFANPIPQLLTPDFAALLARLDMPKIAEYFVPDLGPVQGGGRPQNLDDYRKVFQVEAVPDIANRYLTDESFAYSFVAGPNPAVIKRMTAVPENFPVTTAHLESRPEFAHDSLSDALTEGRVYYVDFATLDILKDGAHEHQAKYVYQPLCAFCVPRAGGLMQPFAIQTGQGSVGRELYTPRDAWSWQIAKGMVMVANFNHHEAVTHLGTTHFVMEAIVVCTYRNLAANHPIHALLARHIVGTLQINFLATTWLLQPKKPFQVLTGAELESVHALAARERLAFDFTGNYLPQRLEARGLTDTKALPLYPYRDDALLIWEAIRDWMLGFVSHYYRSDADILSDRELQSWAREITSPNGGKLNNFGSADLGIQTREELIGVLTMIIFTAGPQHAAVNFTQKTDMAYVPAAPLGGYIPEIKGKGHTAQDYLDFLPPLDVACTSEQILAFLGDVYFDQLGDYGPIFNDSIEMTAVLDRFRARLQEIETTIERQDSQRPFPYPHLKPSKIPQSINI